MSFVRRYTSLPPIDVITEIEGFIIVDEAPSGPSVGLREGVVSCVAEWLKGPYNEPTDVPGSGSIRSKFGGFSVGLTASGLNVDHDGNGFSAIKGLAFRGLVLVRADTRAVKTASPTLTASGNPGDESDLTITLTAATPPTSAWTLPAGTMFSDHPTTPTVVVMTDQDVEIAANDTTLIAGKAVTVQYSFVVGTTVTLDALDTLVTSVSGFTGVAVGAATLPALEGRPATPAGVTITAATNEIGNKPPIATAYGDAILATEPGSEVTDDIRHVWSARRSITADDISISLKANATNSSSSGRGRTVSVTAAPATNDSIAARDTQITAIKALAGVMNSDRVNVVGPYYMKSVPESGTTLVKMASDGLLASTLSVLSNERNPAQRVNAIQTTVRGLEPAWAKNPGNITTYTDLKASGVIALRRKRGIWGWQSGVTSSTTSGRKNIKRRRMADEIQDGLAAISEEYSSLPATQDNLDAQLGDILDLYKGLLSENNSSLQRIEAFFVDDDSLNTPEQRAEGIYLVASECRLLGTLDHIGHVTSIGENQTITEVPAA